MTFDQAELTDDMDGSSVPIPAGLAQAVKAYGNTQLLPFTRQRANATQHAANMKPGAARVAGEGFFVNPVTTMAPPPTRVTRTGFNRAVTEVTRAVSALVSPP